MPYQPCLPYTLDADAPSVTSHTREHVTCTIYGKDVRRDACVAVIGTFDGLHLGHRALIDAAIADADERSVPAVAITFSPAPQEVFKADVVSSRLLSNDDRIAALMASGVDAVACYDFTKEFAALSARDFVEGALLGTLNLAAVHVGENFSFGYRGEGTPETLREICAECGVAVTIEQLTEEDGETVSSTRIRRLLKEGDVASAEHLLGRPHYVRGHVVHGRGEGTSFGFPTANVVCDERIVMPSEGVYATYVTMGTSFWPAATNVGLPPTFVTDAGHTAFLEANLIGFSGDAYGSDVSVEFSEWLRASHPFDSLEELERTVLGNIDWTREHLREGGRLDGNDISRGQGAGTSGD